MIDDQSIFQAEELTYSNSKQEEEQDNDDSSIKTDSDNSSSEQEEELIPHEKLDPKFRPKSFEVAKKKT